MSTKIATLSEPRNVKLGHLIHSWSVPCGKLWSCVGESRLCRGCCYAKRGHFNQRVVKRSHLRNFDFSKTAAFVAWMIASLLATFARVMRIHVGGDFYDAEYINKWYSIASALPDVQFFAYTRSWRQEDLLPELIRLAALPNFQMWWSIDRETGPAPLIRGVRRAYMAIDDIDAELTPNDCDLVFRDRPDTIMREANGVTVCLAETGITDGPKVTCSACGLCWDQTGPVETSWEEHLQETFEETGVEISVR